VLEATREPARTTAPERAPQAPAPFRGDLRAQVLALQRTAGNAAVAQLLARAPWDREPEKKPDASAPDAAAPDASAPDEANAPDNPSREQDPAKPVGVCGPDVTKPLADTLTKIENDFGTWKREDQRKACFRILNPIDFERLKTEGLAAGDYNGWDTYALFSSYANWLRRPPVCGPCATPTSKKPGADWRDKAHEAPDTCSNTVQVGGSCWLAGTVNYATFGMMVRLCGAKFSGDPDMGGEAGALEQAKALIKGYKTFVSKEDPRRPIEWVEEVYRGGPKATVSTGGNRAGCSTTCTQVNPKVNPAALVSWDYVWEPVKPRVPNPPLPSPAKP
jgi:hypothetical protein